MKKQKGITLIALVITIIVMLVLVGVTISVSLNGGLFTTAKEATDETQIAQEKEQLLMAAMGALGENGKVDIGKLDSSLPEGFTGSNGEYTSNETGNVFKVSENGSITLSGEPSVEQPEIPITPEIQEYKLSGTWIFNENINGKEIMGETINFISNNISFNRMLCQMNADDGWTVGYGSSNYARVWTFEQGWLVEDAYKTVNFGSEPQTVSEEFYEWFIANATQQQATQISFTIDGTQYYATEGQTWLDWIIENDMTSQFDCYDPILYRSRSRSFKVHLFVPWRSTFFRFKL